MRDVHATHLRHRSLQMHSCSCRWDGTAQLIREFPGTKLPESSMRSEQVFSDGYRDSRSESDGVELVEREIPKPRAGAVRIKVHAGVIVASEPAMVDLREPLDALIHRPHTYTSHLTFPDPASIVLYDDTLRDGEQMPGLLARTEGSARGLARRPRYRRHGCGVSDRLSWRPPGR